MIQSCQPSTESGQLHLDTFAEGRVRIQPHGEIFALFLDGNFEASLLLLDWLWEGPFREYASGGYVVAVPSRDVLAFTDIRNATGVEELAELIGRVHPQGGHTISKHLHRRIGREWVRHDA